MECSYLHMIDRDTMTLWHNNINILIPVSIIIIIIDNNVPVT